MTAPVAIAQFAAAGAPLQGTILPHLLPGALDLCPQARLLSLDCFDTLLWRDGHAPADLFAALPGITPMQRRFAESQARRVAGFGRGRQEITIAEIYAQLLPAAGPAERQAAVAAERQAAIAAELAAEARHCFAFAPTVELMRQAKARGLQVILVSDTYLDAAQLAALVAAAAGAEVAGLIDRIFPSSAFGKPKALGLYGEVLRKLKVPAREILHIGDNLGADVESVAPYGVNTLHLQQFPEALAQQLRLEAGYSAMLHPPQGQLAAAQPQRAALALALPQQADAAHRLGLATIGPVLAGFDQWLRAEAAALAAARGGRVHWLFLMRDGFLPMAMHTAMGASTEAPARAIEISRFTATAASFAQERDVLRFVEQETGTEARGLARQLLLPAAEIEATLAGREGAEACLALLAHMRRGQVQKQSVRAARANPAPGDTLMLVDLGYNGSVQNRIDALLAKALGVHVAGRYLLLREVDKPGLDKRGFLSADHYDPGTLEAMCLNVAVFEQLCTTTTGSVVDYTPEGEPIRAGNDIDPAQSAMRGKVQQGALAFAHAQRCASLRARQPDLLRLWREGAAATIARLMYHPLAHELAVLDAFEHDVNLGTGRKLALFDRAVARRGLRQRGLFHTCGTDRMYLPAELEGQGLAPKLAFFAQQRFNLPLSFADFTDGGIRLPVMFVSEEGVVPQEITAHATHDGFCMAAVPIADCRYAVAVQLGAACEWLEMDTICALPLADVLARDAAALGHERPVAPSLDGIEQPHPRLWHCAGPASLVLIPPPPREDDTQMVVRLVFRPLVMRQG